MTPVTALLVVVIVGVWAACASRTENGVVPTQQLRSLNVAA